MTARTARIVAVAFAAVLVVAAAGAVAVVTTDGAATPLEGDDPLSVDDDGAGAETTHTWSFDDVDYEGEVDAIAVDYPVGTSLDGLTDENVTVEITREGESEPTEISVNGDEYAGSSATFDLSGIYNTDVDGPVSVTIAGVENPPAGDHVATLAFEGDDTVTAEAEFSVTEGDGSGSPGEPIAADLTLDPATADATATHEWSLDGVDYEGEIDEITVDYPSEASLDGLTNDDVTVEITREGDSEPTDVRVNDGAYAGSQATFDLSGNYNTDVDGPVSVTIAGVENPPAGDHTALLTLDGDDAVTAEAGVAIGAESETLAATVLDADGDPLAESAVAVELSGPTERVALVETDADGVATLDVNESGEYDVTVTSPENGTATESVEIDGTTEATFGLAAPETGTVEALVTTVEGDSLPEGAWASLRGDGLDAPRTGQVDADGIATFAGVPPGEYDLAIETAAGTTDPVAVSVAAGETAATEFTYADEPTTAALAGTVATPDGDALANEPVVVEYEGVETDDGAESGVATVETNAAGEFAVPFVAAGEYELSVTARGFAPSEPATVDAAAGERAAVTLGERAGGSISGVVTDADGEPLPAGTWVSFGADGFETTKTVQLGEDGTFTVDGIAPGSYDVVAETLNRGTTVAHKVNVANGKTTEVEISYAADDSPGRGPPIGVPGEGSPGSDGDGPGNSADGDGPGNGAGNGSGNGAGNGSGPGHGASIPAAVPG